MDDVFLQDVRMGYVEARDPTPYQSIIYQVEEMTYNHPWSFESIGERYGINKLGDVIEFKEFLKLPMHSVNRLIKGLVKGRDERRKLEEEERVKQEARRKGGGAEPPTVDPLVEMAKLAEAMKGKQ